MPRFSFAAGYSVPLAVTLARALALAALVGLSGYAPAAEGAQDAEVELLVGFNGGVTDETADEVLKAHGAVKLEKVRKLEIHRVRVPAQAADSVEQALAKRKEVKFVERNQQLSLETTPNDPLYPSQWHHVKIGSPQAWDVTPGGADVIIAIVDTGVDPTHPDLAAKLVPGFNFFDKNTNSADVVGHGTLVAGAAAAIGNNGLGVIGVGGQSKIMPLRVTDTAGLTYQSTVATAVTWAADNGAKVVNLSIGNVAGSATTTSAAQYARSKGVLVVAAAGNCSCVDATAENPYIVSVGNTDQNDGLYASSSRGNYVDISAPGVLIYSTQRGGGYAYATGTSIASPIVAGVAALMLSANPALKPADVEALLEANADDRGSTAWDTGYGWGRVNAYRAVAAAKTSVPAPDTVAPSVAISAPAPASTVSGVAAVAVSASDNGGISRVELYVDGVFYGSDTTAPYTVSWDTRNTTNGSHAVVAKALDAAGNVGTSASVTVTVNNVSDATKPVVSITSSTVSSNTLSASVSATDNVAVTRVELFIDGAWAATRTAPPYTFSLNLSSVSVGSHVLQAKAYDGAGNSAMSGSVGFSKAATTTASNSRKSK
jgi:thermitase